MHNNNQNKQDMWSLLFYFKSKHTGFLMPFFNIKRNLSFLNRCYTQYYVVLKQISTTNNIRLWIFQCESCVCTMFCFNLCNHGNSRHRWHIIQGQLCTELKKGFKIQRSIFTTMQLHCKKYIQNLNTFKHPLASFS